jgi:hypothetical protein
MKYDLRAGSGLPESCRKNEKVPRFSFALWAALAPSVGALTWKMDLRSVRMPSAPASGVASCAAPLAPIERLKAMQVPSILQGESRTRLLQGIVIGAAATMAIGFSWGGWMTSRTANTLAAEHAQNAVVAALTPICVAKFLQEPDSKANLAALQKISSNWQQGDYLEKGGWATRPGATSPDYLLARACAEKLIQGTTQ